MIHLDATDLQVAILRAAARKLRAAVPLDAVEFPHAVDQVARASIESGQDWRDLTSNRSRYADR